MFFLNLILLVHIKYRIYEYLFIIAEEKNTLFVKENVHFHCKAILPTLYVIGCYVVLCCL